MSTLPTGVVTFLIADVEGSTRLQQDDRLDYPAIIGAVRGVLRRAIVSHGGHEVDAVGDELLAAFDAAAPAVAAALEAQRSMRDTAWPHDLTVRVRVGLHTGEPSFSEEGYTGLDIVRAARIAHAGHGGQIVVSAATLEAVPGTSARDLGDHLIEGLREPERIYQLLADDLARDFPPLRNTSSTLGQALKVVIADDSVLLREGVVRLLSETGFDVVAQSGNADDLIRHVAMHKPDVAVVDIRMPPTHTDEGLRAAAEIRERFPGTGVLVLSQYVESGYAMELLSDSAEGVGYLLKDRVSDVEQFASGGAAGRRGRLGARPRRRQPAPGPPPPRRPARAADAARARGARADGRRPLEPGDRGSALRDPARGREARDEHLHEAEPARRARRTTAACSPFSLRFAPRADPKSGGKPPPRAVRPASGLDAVSAALCGARPGASRRSTNNDLQEGSEMSPLKHSTNVAARMGRWSARHRKIAIWGWLAFVIAVVRRRHGRRPAHDRRVRLQRRRGPPRRPHHPRRRLRASTSSPSSCSSSRRPQTRRIRRFAPS